MKEPVPTKIRTVGTLGAVAIITAICAPLAMPASAALDSGHFFVRAQDQDGIKGSAGMSGELVGNPGGGGGAPDNPIGGDYGATPGGGGTWTPGAPSTPEHALGARMTANVGYLAWTPQGVYMLEGVVDEAQPKLIMGPGDGSSYAVTPTGELEGIMYGDLESDGSGNIYINSRVGNRDNLYRMTPDWNTTLIASFERPQKGYTDYIVSPNGRVAMIQDDILYKVPSGQSRVEVADLPGDSYRYWLPGLAVLTDNGTVYVAQNILEGGDYNGYITAVSSTGEMTREILSSPNGGDSRAWRLTVGADNSVYISGDGYFGRVNSDATMTVLMSNMDGREYEIDAVGSDGAFYEPAPLERYDEDWSVNRYDRATMTPALYYSIDREIPQ